jgi:hypothetical protein
VKRAALLVGAVASLASLAGCTQGRSDAEVRAEIARRETFARAVVVDAGAERMLNVTSTSEVLFQEGFSPVKFDPPDDYHNHAFRWMGQNGHVRLKTHGAKPMRLKIAGWVHEKVIRAKPVIQVFVDGRYVKPDVDGQERPIENGHYKIEAIVSPEVTHGAAWVDLEITCNAVAYHWSDPPELNVVVLYSFEWSEVTP